MVECCGVANICRMWATDTSSAQKSNKGIFVYMLTKPRNKFKLVSNSYDFENHIQACTVLFIFQGRGSNCNANFPSVTQLCVTELFGKLFQFPPPPLYNLTLTKTPH